ncbi:MAG: hypothetical protein IJ946_04905 [Clostridia bacterium]|nr:hypothetical protein [Clostridia bacterium]
MALSDEKLKKYIQRLLLSRMRLLCNHGFYGLLLMNMRFAVDKELDTAATDGRFIYFGPDFLESLSDGELDFVMMHEVLHVVLQHCMRTGERDASAFNIACDIVVNSNILMENGMNLSSITLNKYGEAMHLAPDGKEGYLYTAEQVYEMLPASMKANCGNQGFGAAEDNGEQGNGGNGDGMEGKGKKGVKGNVKGIGKSNWDDHSRWGSIEEDDGIRDFWVKRFEDAVKAVEIRDPSNTRGLMPMFAKRIMDELLKPQTDWRTVLNSFVQEEITDYSFSPPDRRFEESPFFLPDFNEKENVVKDILFMIDTSGSMSDKMITAAYSEIKGAIDQFDGKLKGWLGFFDAAIIEPKPFENEDEFRIIRPAGGGGTSFHIIFHYVKEKMFENPPASIVVLTDGYAPFPAEKQAMGIPVLWLLNNDKVDPPWGKVARIKV